LARHFCHELIRLAGPSQLDVLLMSFHKYLRCEFIRFISIGELTLAKDATLQTTNRLA
jgi:hypothetical protein